VYDFAKRPVWILSHVLVVLAILVMVRLGFWQMSRWDEESRKKDQITAGLASAPVPLGQLVPDARVKPRDVPESVRYKRALVKGTWMPEDEIVIRSRSLQGSPGGWLMTPLRQADGTAVAVVRGWVPLDVANGAKPFKGAEPPTGEATVTGPVGLSQAQPSIGAKDPATGTLDSMIHTDLDRYSRQLKVPLAPVWIMADGMRPPQQGKVVQPVTPDMPTPDTNMSYMFQWWIFATIAAVGYPLILRKVARQKAGLDRRSAPPDDDGVVYQVPAGVGAGAGDPAVEPSGTSGAPPTGDG